MDAPAQSPRVPTWLKITLGCGLAVALIGAAILGALAYGVYWAISPGPQISTNAVIGPHSSAVIQAGDLGPDAGMRALLQHFFEEAQRLEDRGHAQDLPPFLRSLQQWHQSQMGASLMQFMPYELTASYERTGNDGPLGVVIAVNFRQYVRPVRYFVEKAARQSSNEARITHRGHTIIPSKDGGACFLGGTVVFSGDLDLLRATLDRADAAQGASTPDPADLAGLRARWDVSGRTSDGPTTLQLLKTIGVPVDRLAASERPESARFGLDLQSDDDARGLLDLRYPSAAAAAQAEAPVTALLGASALAESTGVLLTWRPRVDGANLTVDLQVTGIRAAVTRSLEESRRKQAERRARRRRNE